MQSFAASLISSSEFASFYGLIALIDGAGSIVAASLLSNAFSKGIQLGGMAQGLPFFVAAALYAISAIGVWSAWANGKKPQ